MASSIPSSEPSSIVAGDSVSWRRELAAYPAPTWVLSYTLTNSDGVIPITASADGAGHMVELTPAETAAFAPGRYSWLGQVSDGVDRHTVGHGVMEIAPDPASAGAYDTRSHARRMLDAIEATLEGRATQGQLDMVRAALNGRDVQRDPTLLIPLHDRYRAQVASEDLAAAAGGEQTGFIQMRFRP